MLKNLLRQFIAALFCFTFIVSAFSPANGATSDRYGYQRLTNDQQKAMYNALVNGVSNLETQIKFNAQNVTAEDLQFAEDMFLADYPEYFWFDSNLSITVTTHGEVECTVINGYLVNGTRVDASSIGTYIAQVESAANRILSGMPNTNNYDKALYLHDTLAQKVSYQSVGDHQTIYGALVSGKAVCAGYARAYQYLLQKAGIQSWYVTGNGYNEVSGNWESHGWNLVFLDGKCYYTDVTWDDQPERIVHTYFMNSLDRIQTTHQSNVAQYLPAGCGHNDQAYYTIKSGRGTGIGAYKNNLKPEEVAGWCKQEEAGKYVCLIQDDGTDIVNWLQTNYLKVCEQLGLSNGNFTAWSLLDEFTITFTGTPKTEHVHDTSLKKVPAKSPTCTSGGNIEYYTCSGCQTLFADKSGNQVIQNPDTVKLSPVNHNYSVWKYDAANHWKVCTCGAVDSAAKAVHADVNRDGKCDICLFNMQGGTTEDPTLDTSVNEETDPVPTEEPTVGSTEEATKEPVNTEETTNQTTMGATEEISSAPSVGTIENTVTSTSASEPITQITEDAQSSVAPIIIGLVLALVAVAVAVTVIIHIRKKQ